MKEPNCVCRDCAFLGPLKESVLHHQATGHALVYKGVVQDFTDLIRESAEFAALLTWHDEALARGQQWAKDRP